MPLGTPLSPAEMLSMAERNLEWIEKEGDYMLSVVAWGQIHHSYCFHSIVVTKLYQLLPGIRYIAAPDWIHSLHFLSFPLVNKNFM